MQLARFLNVRLVVIALFALVLVAAFAAATGGGLSTSKSSLANLPTATPIPTRIPRSAHIRGEVRGTTQRIGAGTIRFRYTIRNTGNTPIAGFQLNSPHANLFAIRNPQDWTAFGSGVCGGKYPGVLIYWTISASGGNVLRPKSIATFSFDVKTTGSRDGLYSLSWGPLSPFFGHVAVPKRSNSPTTGTCSR